MKIILGNSSNKIFFNSLRNSTIYKNEGFSYLLENSKSNPSYIKSYTINQNKIIVFGRLYNSDFKKLILARRYDELVGQFTILIISSNDFEIITDSSLNVPFFVYENSKKKEFIISSDLNLLLERMPLNTSIDWQQAFSFIYTSRTTNNKTLLKDIKILKNGSITSYRRGLNIEKWWKPSFKYKNSKDHLNEYCENLSKVVELAIKSNSNPIISITSGFDSRAIVASALSKNLNFTLSSWGSWHLNKLHIDNLLAESISNQSGLPLLKINQEKIKNSFQYYYDSVQDNTFGLGRHSFMFMSYYRDQLSKKNFDVELEGTGAETLKGIYYKDNLDLTDNSKKTIIKNSFFMLKKIHKLKFYPSNFFDILIDLEKKITEDHFDSIPEGLNDHEALDYIQYRNRSQQRWWARTGYINKSFNTFYPYRSTKLLELSFAIPAKEKVYNKFQKKVVKTLWPKLSEIPYGADFIKSNSIISKVAKKINFKNNSFIPSDYKMIKNLVDEKLNSSFFYLKDHNIEPFNQINYKKFKNSFGFSSHAFRMLSVMELAKKLVNL